VTGLTLETGAIKDRPCPTCGGREHMADGIVRREPDPIGAYWIGWTVGGEHEQDRVVHLTVSLGDWSVGGDPDSCDAFHVEIRRVRRGLFSHGPGMGLVDRPYIADGGTNLTREEALAHPSVDLLWEVADLIVADDPHGCEAMRWLSDGS
jgi:hypothetical protein